MNEPQVPLNLRDNPFLESLGVKFIKFEEASAIFEMEVSEKHLRSLGILHGGVTCTLLDTAMGTACIPISPDTMFPVTAQLNINFTRPAWSGEKLRIIGTRLHAGKNTVVCRGELFTDQGILVAAASGTFLFVPRPAGVAMQKLDDNLLSQDKLN